jgi:hypothetical protein
MASGLLSTPSAVTARQPMTEEEAMNQQFSRKMALAIGMIGMALAGGSPAQAGGRVATITTASLVPDVNGYLYCEVSASGATPVDARAAIMSADNTNVTQFGSGFRATPAVSGDGNYYAQETAGSLDDGARYCKVTVTGARRSDIDVTLKSFDAGGKLLDTIVGH